MRISDWSSDVCSSDLIRDALRAETGPFTAVEHRLAEEAEQIAEDREDLERRSTAYHDQLVQQFTAMERQVSAFKATQSYLEQQIKMWNSRDRKSTRLNSSH